MLLAIKLSTPRLPFYLSNTMVWDSTSLSMRILTRRRKHNSKRLREKKSKRRKDVYGLRDYFFQGRPKKCSLSRLQGRKSKTKV